MASVTSSTGYYAQLAASNKAVGGLVSGMDTDALVEAMTLATRTKLAKQTQQKTLLNWKMTAYRSVASTLRAFQSKHISFASSASLKSNTFFDVFKGTSTSDKITVKPGSGASTGSFTVQQVKQLATSQTFTTDKFQQELSGNEITLGGDFIGKTLQLSLDGSTKTIKLDDLDGITDKTTFENTLQKLIDKAFGQKSASPTDSTKVSIINATLTEATPASGGDPATYKISLDADVNTVVVKNNADGLGLTVNMANRVSMESKISDMFPGLIGDTLKFSINDVEFTANRDDTISSIIAKVNNSSAGVKISFSSINEDFVITSKVTGEGDNLRMNDIQGNFLNEFIGARGGNSFASTAAYTSLSATGAQLNVGTLDDARYTELAKTTLKLTVGTTTATLSLDISKYKDKIEDPGDPMTAEQAVIESLNAQIEAKFGENSGISFGLNGSGQVTFNSTKTDMQVKLVGNTTVGITDGVSSTALTLGYEKVLTGGAISGNIADLLNDIRDNADGYSMNLTIDGVTKEITVKVTQAELDALNPKLPEGVDDYALLDPGQKAEYDAKLLENQQKFLANKLNSAKSTAFSGSSNAAKVTFSVSGNNEVSLTATDASFKFAVSDSGAASAGNLFQSVGLGAAGGTLQNFGVGQGAKLSEISNITNGSVEISLGGTLETFAVDQNTTLQDFMDAVNGRFGRDIISFVNGKMVIDGGTQDIAFEDNGTGVMSTLFGHMSYETDGASAEYQTRMAAGMGTNAEIVMNGQIISSTTNTFTVNGVAFEVNGVTEADADIVINVTTDPDDVVAKIKTFIEEYNVLVDAMYAILGEKSVSGYAPLTDEQRSEMTEDQIKSWEAEAKKGLLYNDPTIRGIMTQMRTALYEKVEAAGISLYDIGISTESYSSTNNGRLELTENGETKLRNMLDQNPDAVRTLFTDENNGLANKLDSIINSAVNTSSTKQGSLVAIAGTEVSTGNNESTLSKKIDLLDKQIATLKTRLENEYNRYWKKFSALETAISNLNTQSGWLASFGS